MRFLVDENLPVDIVQLLEDAGHDVAYVARPPLAGIADPVLNEIAIREGRIIVTRDLDFPLREAEMPPGMILVRIPSQFRRSHIRSFFETLMTTAEFSSAEDHVIVATPNQVRARRIDRA